MEVTTPVYAKTVSETLKARHSWHQAQAQAPAPRSVQPERRALSRLFRRDPQPSTFHRCLAVHIHFAQRASALD
jgi:hypothetical protein